MIWDCHVDFQILITYFLQKSTTYFLEGNYKKGWKHYKHRFDHFDYLNKKIKNFDKNKKWTGQPIEDNKKILFFCEQGIGDTINFIRFIKDFTNKFPKVKNKIIAEFGLIW